MLHNQHFWAIMPEAGGWPSDFDKDVRGTPPQKGRGGDRSARAMPSPASWASSWPCASTTRTIPLPVSRRGAGARIDAASLASWPKTATINSSKTRSARSTPKKRTPTGGITAKESGRHRKTEATPLVAEALHALETCAIAYKHAVLQLGRNVNDEDTEVVQREVEECLTWITEHPRAGRAIRRKAGRLQEGDAEHLYQVLQIRLSVGMESGRSRRPGRKIHHRKEPKRGKDEAPRSGALDEVSACAAVARNAARRKVKASGKACGEHQRGPHGEVLADVCEKLPKQCKEHLHDLDRHQSIRVGNGNRRHFKCKRCGGAYSLGVARRLACPATPAEVRLTLPEFASQVKAANPHLTKKARRDDEAPRIFDEDVPGAPWRRRGREDSHSRQEEGGIPTSD